MNYNSAFFGLFENVFKLMQTEQGEKNALDFFTKLMEMGLSKSYGNDFIRGDYKEFERKVSERDAAVGLRVEFELMPDNKLVYRFYDDPFPNLKGLVEFKELDRCYMGFKVKYFLGEEWDYETTKHFWKGDECIEHIIYKM